MLRTPAICQFGWSSQIWNSVKQCEAMPIGSMYAIYGNIYHQYTPNVSIYAIHGSYGMWNMNTVLRTPSTTMTCTAAPNALRSPPCRTEGSARVFADAGRPHASWVPWCHWGNGEMEAGCSFLFINLVGGVNWKIWVRQLGIFFPTYGKIHIHVKKCSKAPTSNVSCHEHWPWQMQWFFQTSSRGTQDSPSNPWACRWQESRYLCTPLLGATGQPHRLAARWCISQQFRVITWSFDEFWCCRKNKKKHQCEWNSWSGGTGWNSVIQNNVI